MKESRVTVRKSVFITGKPHLHIRL